MDALALLVERLPGGSISTHPGELTRRARDWWALAMLRERGGDPIPPPLAVVFPKSTEEVATILAWADETGMAVVPRGGGSGVCGGAQAIRGGIVLDLSEMHRVLSIDEESLAVEVEAGIRGDQLERELADRRMTLGHYPQSLAISSVGGWIAARSAGQASAGYGVIEDLLLGLTVVLSGGRIARLPATPRSAAGPDLRRLFVGSEGTLGVVTEATLSASRLPEGYEWLAFRPPGFFEGMGLVRSIVQAGTRTVVIRLYDEADAALAFSSAGHTGGPVLIVGFAADAVGARAAFDAVAEEARVRSAAQLPPSFGAHWWEHRMDAVATYRQVMGEDRLFGDGVIVDTMEVAGLWSILPKLYDAIRSAIEAHAEGVGCHLSHPYRSGGSLYFTFLLRAPSDREAEKRYVDCWRDAAAACQDAGGTITHHHGVGILKALFMERELGTGGLDLLRSLKTALDPRGVLNPGKLLPPDA